MDPLFEPDAYQEEDEGYSIPKILVAVLLLVLIVGGVLYYRDHQKYKKTLVYLKEERKKVTQQLDAMIERYNMAIDDNSFLADELKAERDKIINLKKNVGNLKEEDFKGMTGFKKELQQIEETSAFITDNLTQKPTTQSPPTAPKQDISAKKPIVQNQQQTKQSGKRDNRSNQKIKTESSTPKTVVNETTPETDIASSNTADGPAIESVNNTTPPSSTKTSTEVTATETKNAKQETQNNNTQTTSVPQYLTLNSVEVPPTFPGCAGSADAKKKCLQTNIKKYVAKHFDTSVAEGLDIEPNKRIRTYVAFDIDKYGKVVNIKTRSPYKELANEAVKTIKTLPAILPGRHKGKTATVHNIIIPIDYLQRSE